VDTNDIILLIRRVDILNALQLRGGYV